MFTTLRQGLGTWEEFHSQQSCIILCVETLYVHSYVSAPVSGVIKTKTEKARSFIAQGGKCPLGSIKELWSLWSASSQISFHWDHSSIFLICLLDEAFVGLKGLINFSRISILWLLGPQGQQQSQATNMTPQLGMRSQYPNPQITKQQPMSTVATQGTTQQLTMQQAVQRSGAVPQAQMATQQVFYDKSGLTQHQILTQHLQQQQHQQQPQQQQLPPLHQLQTQNLLQNQAGHHQMTQVQSHVNVPPGQVASPMPGQQQPVLPGRFEWQVELLSVVLTRTCWWQQLDENFS